MSTKTANTSKFKVFKHPQDILLVLLAGLNLAIFIHVLLQGEKIGTLGLSLYGVLLVLFYCTNVQCVAHYFVHFPFFNFSFLNGLFSIMNSLNLGLPQTLYRVYHWNHHRFNNDIQDEQTGETGDYSSFYRFSQEKGKPEGIWRYSLLGAFRLNFGPLIRMCIRQGRGIQLLLETLALVAFAGLFLYLQPKLFFCFYLPAWYFGQVVSFMENYLEHYKATPGDRLRDSVSCYNPLYNLLWFNNGYHQEHHYRPDVHWTKLPALKERMLPEEKRRVVPFFHGFVLFKDIKDKS